MIITDCIFAVKVQVQNCCSLMQRLFTQVPRRSVLLVILVTCLSWDFIWSTSYKRSCLVHFFTCKTTGYVFKLTWSPKTLHYRHQKACFGIYFFYQCFTLVAHFPACWWSVHYDWTLESFLKSSEVEETLKRIQGHRGVIGVIIVDMNG